MLLQTGTDRVAFSDIDGGEATGFAFPDEDIDACPCKLRTALRFTQQGAGADDAQPRPVGFLDQAEAVRYAVGDEMKLMLDSMWAYQYEDALRIGRAIEDLDFYWYEDPLVEEDIYNYVKLKSKLDIPIMST